MKISKGRVYWITGLSGAGKTTIGTALYNELKKKKETVVILDGDTLREVYCGIFSYSEEDRAKGGLCNAKLCHLLAEQGIDVVCCTIAMYESIREWSRKNNEKYTEIYLKVDMETLFKRDKKGLYSSHDKNLVGVSIKMDEPKHPDLVIHNNGQETVTDIVNRILSYVG